jgi:hypothetical protein
MAQFVWTIRVKLCSYIFIALLGFGFINKPASAAPCSTVQAQENVTIASDCSDLILQDAGNVVVSGVANISSLPADNWAIYNNSGTTKSITNNATISAVSIVSSSTFGIYSIGNITTLNNSSAGTISTQGVGGDTFWSAGILNEVGTITTLNNSDSAKISSTTTGANSSALGILNTGIIGALNNSGNAIISSADNGTGLNGGAAFAIVNMGGTITALTNSGSATISATSSAGTILVPGTTDSGAAGIYNSGTITALNNIGNAVISVSNTGVGGAYGIFNGNLDTSVTDSSLITSLNNSGVIRVSSIDDMACGIHNRFLITTLTNTGEISTTSVTGMTHDIWNVGTINTLNNTQGGNSSSASSTALTYDGNVPVNYNIGIVNSTHYGQLAVTSPSGPISNFGIYGTPFITSRTYAGVLTNNVSVTSVQSKYDNMSLALVSHGSVYDLTFSGVSLMGTQQSLLNISSVLHSTFNLQTSIINNGLNYDCSLFDAHGLCISAGGRYTITNTPIGDSTGALVIGGYRVNDHVRVGAYLDQGVASSMPTGINLKQHNPLFGVYGLWQARQDGLGSQVKVAAGYNDSDMTVTRAVVGISEAGSGSTSLTSQAVSLVGSYGVEMQGSWIASPYAGIRYTDVKAGGYAEVSSSSVTAPLSYASLSQSTTSLLAGIRWSGKLTDGVGLNGSLGVEQDVSNSNSNYTAAGVTGLTSTVFNTDINKTRPVASIGTTVSIDKKQQLAFSVFYSEQAFSNSSATSAYGTYTIGF